MVNLPYAISKHRASHRRPQQHASIKCAFLESHEDRKEYEDRSKMVCDCTAQENQRPVTVGREVGWRTLLAIDFVTRSRSTDGFAARRIRKSLVV